MSIEMKIFIDPWTCDMHRVIPDVYKERLNEELREYHPTVVVNHVSENTTRGDYSRTGAITLISDTVTSSDPATHKRLFDIAKQVFDDLKLESKK